MQDLIVEKLNSQFNDINTVFQQDRFEGHLKINNFSPIYFDNSAGGPIANGSCNWLQIKHRNGLIHEPATLAALLFIYKNYSNRIDVIFDVGALYGYFSLISKSIFQTTTVFSFEVNPESYIALCKNINSNKHLGIPSSRCMNIGLSDQTNLQKAVEAKGFHLRENKISENSTKIDIFSLDDFCRISGFRPNLIKIDVEGYQAKIIPGSLSTLAQSKPIILLEFDDPKTLAPFQITNQDICKPLFELGYQCYWCQEQRTFKGRFEPLNYDQFSQKHESNSLAIFLPI